MNIPFWKLSGAGNDFVLLERLPKHHSGAALAKKLCDRHLGIGADGLLIATKKSLDYWNADGSKAFCGNGTRAGVIWAAKKGWLKGREFELRSNGKRLRARLTAPGRAEVDMPRPKKLKLGMSVDSLQVNYVDTGVPHAVVFVDDVEKANVKELGRHLRFHKAFGRAGANVNFVEITKDALLIRTYERGVEDETLACGTGIVASAFISRVLGRADNPVKVKVRGGDILKVSFKRGPRLEGPAVVTFTGEVQL